MNLFIGLDTNVTSEIILSVLSRVNSKENDIFYFYFLRIYLINIINPELLISGLLSSEEVWMLFTDFTEFRLEDP